MQANQPTNQPNDHIVRSRLSLCTRERKTRIYIYLNRREVNKQTAIEYENFFNFFKKKERKKIDMPFSQAECRVQL